jgi:hypothetical protein
MIGTLEVLHDRRSDVALAEADDVCNEDPTSLLDGYSLKGGKAIGNFVILQDVPFVIPFDPIPDKRVQGLHVHVVRPNRSYPQDC